MALALPLPPAAASGGAAGFTELTIAEPVVFDANAGVELLSLASDAASAAAGGANLNGLHNVRVVFPAGWDGGSPAVVTARRRDGSEAEESFAYAGPGEHVVEGVEVCAAVVSVACPGAGAGLASLSVQVGARACAAQAPVAEFLGLFAQGIDYTADLAGADLARGTVRVEVSPGVTHDLDAGSYVLLYRAAPP